MKVEQSLNKTTLRNRMFNGYYSANPIF